MPTKTSSVSFPARYQYHASQGGPSTTPGSVTADRSKVITAVRTRTGVSLPKFKTIIRNGGSATTPLTGTYDGFNLSGRTNVSYDLQHADGSWAKRSVKGDVALYHYRKYADGSPLPPPVSGSGTAENRARQRFFKKLREVQVQVSGPTFLGELREAVQMIRRPAAAIRESQERYFRAMKQWRGAHRPPTTPNQKWKWRKELEKVAGGLWLEQSFGWKPLLNDIEQGVLAYERLTPPIVDSILINVGDSDSEDLYKGLVAEGTNYFTNKNIDGCVFDSAILGAKQSRTVRYRGRVTGTTEAPTWERGLDLFGFTPSEFVPTAWELLPWSFLIDYFANIGNLLTNSVTRTSGVNWVNRTERNTISLSMALYPNAEKTRLTLGAAWNISGGGAVTFTHLKRTTVDRGQRGSVPLPFFQFDSGLNVGQMCNITALLTQFGDGVHPQDNPRHGKKRFWF